ncbi:hypothetical protein R1sor_003185 [Riccia sorocarpa]|uniref:Reverse transcriptase zinc-binding domain-containing protein n=1 Tax=Riccia sorocarpa TaxID=122646 RepID=A0ABD3H1N6_9MARC
MILGLTQKGYKSLDRLCWQFIWGKTKEGTHRKPLIAWEKLCKEKAEGGLEVQRRMANYSKADLNTKGQMQRELGAQLGYWKVGKYLETALESKTLPRDKLWLWRIVNKGFFTHERAAAMEVADPLCVRCKTGTENIEHMFLQCRKVNSSWQLIARLHGSATDGGEPHENSLIKALEKMLTPDGSTLLLLFIAFSRFVWRDQCNEVFKRNHRVTPVKVILQEAEKMALGLAKKQTAEDALAKLMTTSDNLARMRALHQRSIINDNDGGLREDENAQERYSHRLETNETNNDRRMCQRGAREGNRTRERSPSWCRESGDPPSSPSTGGNNVLGARNFRDELAMLGFIEVQLPDSPILDSKEVRVTD